MRTGYLQSVNHGAHWRIYQNAKSHLTSPGPRPVHFAVSNWWDHFWQIDNGPLSLDVQVLSIGPHMDERRDHLWKIGANALSLDVPILPGDPQMDDHDGPKPKRYKKETPLNTASIQCVLWL